MIYRDATHLNIMTFDKNLKALNKIKSIQNKIWEVEERTLSASPDRKRVGWDILQTLVNDLYWFL